jgi:RNA polymerase sigma factor (sigma-70 family)
LILAFIAARGRRDDVDDIHQEVWRRVWEQQPDHYRAGHFRAWLHRVARNLDFDFIRPSPPEPIDDQSSISDRSGHRPDRELIDRERADALRRCLERLDAGSRDLVRARLEGVGYAEIGIQLGIEAAQAHRIFYKAKERLRDCLRGFDS